MASWAEAAALPANSPVPFVKIEWNSGTRYYATDYVHEQGTYYRAKILQLPTLTSSIGDTKRSFERGKVSIVFSDTDREFRTLMETETVGPKNIAVTIYLGLEEAASGLAGNALELYSGRIYGWTFLDLMQFRLDIEPNFKNATNTYPTKTITRADWPNAADDCIGLTIPMLFGVISSSGLSNDGAWGWPALANSTGLPLIDKNPAKKYHYIGCVPVNVALSVSAIYKNGDVVASNLYGTDSTTEGGVTYYSLYWTSGNDRPEDTDFITADITTSVLGPVWCIKNFMVDVCGYVTGEFNATSYSAAVATENARTYKLDGAITEAKTLSAILDEWREEFELDLFWNKAGEICFSYLRPSAVSSPTHYTDVTDILEGFQSIPQSSDVLNQVRFGYNYHWGKTYYYSGTTYDDAAAQTKLGETYSEYKGFKWVRDSTVAWDLAARRVIRFKGPAHFDRMKFPLKTFIDGLSDIILVTHYGGRGASGYSQKYFQIRAQNFELVRFTSDVLLEDISAFVGRGCILGNGSVLPATWTSATEAQQVYCYMADNTTGEFSDGEPGKRLVD